MEDSSCSEVATPKGVLTKIKDAVFTFFIDVGAVLLYILLFWLTVSLAAGVLAITAGVFIFAPAIASTVFCGPYQTFSACPIQSFYTTNCYEKNFSYYDIAFNNYKKLFTLPDDYYEDFRQKPPVDQLLHLFLVDVVIHELNVTVESFHGFNDQIHELCIKDSVDNFYKK